MPQYLQNPLEQTLFEMAASRDCQSEEVDASQAELATIDAEIAKLQAKRALLGESIATAKHRVEEIDLQLEQQQCNRGERSVVYFA